MFSGYCVLPGFASDASEANMADWPKVKRKPLRGRSGTFPVSLYGKDSTFSSRNRHVDKLFFALFGAVPTLCKNRSVSLIRHIAARVSPFAHSAKHIDTNATHSLISVHRKKFSCPPKKSMRQDRRHTQPPVTSEGMTSMARFGSEGALFR